MALLLSKQTALAPATNDGSALGSTSLMWADAFFGSGAVLNFNNGDVTVTHATDLLTIAGAGLKPAAGTTSYAPVTLQSGTNLTAAAAGSIEYDGTAGMFTPLGTQRGVIPAMQVFVLNADRAGSNATGAQSLFGKSCTVTGSTIYRVIIGFTLLKTAGTTSHTISFSFGGTATISWIRSFSLYSQAQTANDGTAGTAVINTSAAASSLFTTNASTAATSSYRVYVVFNIAISAGGTLTPQYTLSAAPGGAYSTKQGSFAEVYPLAASGADVNIGTWA